MIRKLSSERCESLLQRDNQEKVEAERMAGRPADIHYDVRLDHNKGKDKGKKVKVVDSACTRIGSKALRYSTHCQGITQFYLHTVRFIREWNQPYLPLPSQPQLVLIH